MLHVPDLKQQVGGALDRTGVLAVLACIALLFGIGAASLWQSSENSLSLTLAQGTRLHRNNAAAILMVATDAETSQRGYLLTLQADELSPLAYAEQVMPDLLASLAASRPGDARVPLVREVLGAKLAELRQTVRLAQGGDLEGALAIVRTNSGSINMQLLRKHIAVFEAEYDRILASQVAVIRRGGRRLVAIDVAGLVMILALAGLIAFGLRRYLATLRAAQAQTAKAYDALEHVNERLDETVRHRTAELTLANDEIQRFAYIVSHDLRAPLVNIMGFTSELEQAAGALSRYVSEGDAPADLREVAAEDIPEALRFIRSSTSKMDRLINAILRLSREGRRVLSPEQLDMPAMLRGVVDSLQHQVASAGATVTVGAAPPVIADRLAVEQVFSNVVENALKYLKAGRPGVVSITGRVEGSMAVYDIADNGRGIAERDSERIFELFRRAGDQSVPGEGIGLAHTRALVRRLGGNIGCRSALDVGTTFTITLPRAPRREMEPTY